MINYTVYYYIASTVHHNIKHYGIIQKQYTALKLLYYTSKFTASLSICSTMLY